MIERVKIDKVCKISNGYAFKSVKYTTNEGARVIRITNVQKSKIVDNDPKIYPLSELSALDNYKIFEGDILMSLTGNVGRVGKFPKELLPAYINQRVCRIMPKTKKLDVNYLFHFLNSDIFESDAIRNSAGAAQLNLSTNWLADYEIPLPPLPTQQKIATILDKADELRQYNKQLIEKYEALTQSLFLDMFGDPVRNEKGWNTSKLGELSDMSSGSTPTRTNDKNFIGNIPWVKTTEVNGKLILDTLEKISEDALQNSSCKLFPIGSIIIAMYGQGKTRGQIGILGIEATTNQACCVLKPSTKINFTFLYYALSNLYEDLRELGRGGNQPNLNLGLLKTYAIINPKIELQNQFAERVQAIEAQKQQAQEALEKSEALFKGLLQKAFKGELN